MGRPSDEPEECPCCGGCFASPPRCHHCEAPLERLSPTSPLQIVQPPSYYEQLQKRLDEEEV